MIDEKKIEEAAYIETMDMYGETDSLVSGFITGAHWALGEFLKDLWHDVDEMPQRAKAFIFECGDDDMNYHVGMMFNPDDYKKNAETWHMNRWCYLSDILPQEGGGK